MNIIEMSFVFNNFPICLAKKSQTLLRIAIMNIRLVVAISYSLITLDNTMQRES